MKILEGDFRDLVSTVTETEEGVRRAERILDLAAAELRCPACDAVIAAGERECPDCGLYVGVPEEFLAEEE